MRSLVNSPFYFSEWKNNNCKFSVRCYWKLQWWIPTYSRSSDTGVWIAKLKCQQ